MTRWILCIATICIVGASVFLQWSIFAAEQQPKRYVVDRSAGNDNLYHCTLHIPNDLPVTTISLILKDRQDQKLGEALLGTIDTADEKIVPFFLNHELIKRSVVIVAIHPLDDDRHKQVKFVVGDQPAILKENGKAVTKPIE